MFEVSNKVLIKLKQKTVHGKQRIKTMWLGFCRNSIFTFFASILQHIACSIVFKGTDPNTILQHIACSIVFKGTDPNTILQHIACSIVFKGTDPNTILQHIACSVVFKGTDPNTILKCENNITDIALETLILCFLVDSYVATEGLLQPTICQD